MAAEHIRWLRANHYDLAPLTGTDRKALDAIAACWQLYAYERCAWTLDAVALLLVSMQPKNHHFAMHLIPWAMDWNDEGPVWTMVVRAMDAQRERRPESKLGAA
jgi:hypothetical protein